MNHSLDWRGMESKRIVAPFYLPRNLPLKRDEHSLSRRSLAQTEIDADKFPAHTHRVR
jgi:hypothetical protein